MTIANHLVKGGNIDEPEQDSGKSIMAVISVVIMLTSAISTFFIYRWLRNDEIEQSATLTSHGYHVSDSGLWFLLLVVMLLLATSSICLVITFFPETTFVTTSLGALIFVISMFLLMNVNSTKPMSLAEWAEQRYGIILDEKPPRKEDQVKFVYNNDSIGIYHYLPEEDSFLLYDPKINQELPLKGIS